MSFRTNPAALGVALLVYGLGLRHAVDADHIAAIDNVTRKLMQMRQHPVSVGFFFALGHSTLVILVAGGVAAGKGASFAEILIFPILFAAGMSLADTTDGVVMLGAYEWAFVKPMRKLYYNMAITLISILLAALIGGVEAFGLIGAQFSLKGWFWERIGVLNENFDNLGFAIVGIFLAAWALSYAL